MTRACLLLSLSSTRSLIVGVARSLTLTRSRLHDFPVCTSIHSYLPFLPLGHITYRAASVLAVIVHLPPFSLSLSLFLPLLSHVPVDRYGTGPRL
ncbi:uncharacterized protein B0H18DRAFT_1013638 [Fomitopsis serialis]|uniref:uncharacterized protein n=1 Tax=Fomitopsis serialis TaxID=139415 RepID=UPI0020079742|nr:uncharacterized protein B0H18DRAFT_1013638 [Neoantrodia serialis]KAH9923846.1 hypothetical protein B0H18DRAFT_1013638 [Neoantrodia serialis]